MIAIFYMIIVPLFFALLLGFVAIPNLMLYSYTKNIFQFHSEEGSGEGDKFGGFAFFPIMAIVFCLTLILPHANFIQLFTAEEFNAHLVDETGMRLMQLIIGCAMLFLVGLKSDLGKIKGSHKFFIVIAACSLFPISRLWIADLHGLFGIHVIPFWLGMPLTVLFAFLLTSTFRLMDGLDGLASGSGLIISLFILGISTTGDFGLPCVVSSTLIGLLLPFWGQKMLNKKWRGTMMGESGSLVLGYLIAYMVLGCLKQAHEKLPEDSALLAPALILLPLFEAFRVFMSRLRDNRNLTTPDRNQINHKLVRVGLRGVWIVLAIILYYVVFVVSNAWLLSQHINLTYLLLIDLLYWVMLHLLANRLIHSRENMNYKVHWNKIYGREAWMTNDNWPQETISGGGRRRSLPTSVKKNAVPAWSTIRKGEGYIGDGMSSLGSGMKRITDILISALCLILFSPMFILTYIAVRLGDGGPAIYKQQRVGRFGRPFYIYKFRSMRMDAEKFGPALYNATEGDDPRLTKVGRFIRAHHLDELPQLWNVFTGDMSFIGYRPERQFYIDQILERDPRYVFLYQIRPGVTSYATLYNGYTDTVDKMVRRLEYDLYYLQERSWWLDMHILWNTFISIVFGKKF